jgi:hydrogenase nickel incorporation protein HypA/HybF
MHEMGIASSVLDAVRVEAVRHGEGRPCKVGLRVGEMSALDEDSLRFCFEAMTSGTDLESLQLEIEICPRRHRCTKCSREFVVLEYNVRCPQCASLETECVGGDELELAYLEVEENGTCTATTKSVE